MPESARKFIAVIAGNVKEARGYCYSRPPEHSYWPVDLLPCSNHKYDEIQLVGSWYANRDLLRIYLQTLSLASYQATVTVIR